MMGIQIILKSIESNIFEPDYGGGEVITNHRTKLVIKCNDYHLSSASLILHK